MWDEERSQILCRSKDLEFENEKLKEEVAIVTNFNRVLSNNVESLLAQQGKNKAYINKQSDKVEDLQVELKLYKDSLGCHKYSVIK